MPDRELHYFIVNLDVIDCQQGLIMLNYKKISGLQAA